MFPHCMFRVEVSSSKVMFSYANNTYLQNIVPGIPTLSLPDVCTASPVRGKAFCLDHCKYLKFHRDYESSSATVGGSQLVSERPSRPRVIV